LQNVDVCERVMSRAAHRACLVGHEREFDRVVLSIGAQVDRARRARTLTLEQLARRAGLGERTVRAVLNLETDVKLSTLVKLAAALDSRLIVVAHGHCRTTGPN
jgi:hypothetical protein